MSATLARADHFLGWWLTELAGCAPEAWRDRLFGARAAIEITSDAAEVVVRYVSRGAAVDLGRFPLETAGSRDWRDCLRKLKQGGTRVPATIILRLPDDQVLDVQADAPALAAAHLDEVLALDLDRRTPFEASEVFFDHEVLGPDPSGERLHVRMRVARRSDVLRVFEIARSLGVRPTRVDGPDPSGRSRSPFNLLPPDKRARPARLRRRLAAVALILALAGAGALAVVGYGRLTTELSAVDATIGQLREQAKRVQSVQEESDELVAGLGALTKLRTSRPTAAEIIDEITRRFPDGHWLVGLRLDEDELRLSGFSTAPSDLLRSLATSDLLDDVAFASPLVADPRAEAERFAIRATISPGKTAP